MLLYLLGQCRVLNIWNVFELESQEYLQVLLKVGLQTLAGQRARTLVLDTPILLSLVGCLS
jgi:hypothetical protein